MNVARVTCTYANLAARAAEAKPGAWYVQYVQATFFLAETLWPRRAVVSR